MANKLISVWILISLGLLCITSCSNHRADINNLQRINLEENITAQEDSPLKPVSFSYIGLDSDNPNAFFMNASILDVIGDTIILAENNHVASRLLMFDLKDGRFIGQINHRGQGPGEYRLLHGVFPNREKRTVLLTDMDRSCAYSYSLTNDSLLNTIDIHPVITFIDPTGNTDVCINFAQPTPEGLTVYQYDSDLVLLDSIIIKDFKGNNFSVSWQNSGDFGLIVYSDTLFSLNPGHIQPLVILDKGKYTLSSENEHELMEKIMYYDADEKDLLKPFILIRDLQFTENKLLLTTMYDGLKQSALYDISNGKRICTFTFENLEKPSTMLIDGNDMGGLPVESLFAKEGKWYGIVPEDISAGFAVSSPDNTNCAIVTFSLE